MFKNIRWIGLVVFVAALFGLATGRHTLAQSRIAGPVNSEEKVEVPGSKSLLVARSGDTGRVPGSQPLGRMVLMLAGSQEQDRAAEALVAALHDSSSPSYHKWLTPAQYGQQFGISPEDAASVQQWLQGHGLTVHEISQSHRFVVFSGNVAQVERAFSTEMHSYSYNGKMFIANSTNIQIPAALQQVVKGVVRLYGDPHTPALKIGEKISVDKKTGKIEGPYGLHFLAPADFATIYNVKPLYAAGIDGTGQTIAIVSRSSLVDPNYGIDGMQDIRDFRNAVGLPANDPEIIINGDDPLVISYGDTAEAMLDVTWAGAIAPGAHIKVVASQSNFADGVDASAAYIVDHNLAPIMSTSFGSCESTLGSVQNAFYKALWQQAAAQGITAFVSAGDNGGAGCDEPGAGLFASNGLAVNGIASTPYNIAVGGTQFDDAANPDTYWNVDSDPVTLQSVLGYIPEKVWNESSNDPFGTSLWAGSGGVSTVYAKPAWQAAPGVPNDGKRDLPDISLAAAGHTGYAVCWLGSCSYPDYLSFYTFGGTSASSPSAAGVMALVLQAMNGQPQGLANYTFYRLASVPGVYHDITVGDNKVPGPDGQYTVGYSAGPGYDLVTGLGTFDAHALVVNWKAASAASGSTTTLALGGGQASTVAHGSSVKFNTKISCSGAGCTAPTGSVALLATSAAGDTAGVGAGTLIPASPNSTATLLTPSIPGGTYSVSARYSGDGKYYASSSNSVNVTVTAEPSQMALGYVASGYYNTAPASVSYAEPLPLFVAVGGKSGQGYPTGQITLLTDGQPASVLGSDYQSPNTLTLNYGEISSVFTNGTTFTAQSSTFPRLNWGLPVGAHQLQATYPGDNSFGPSQASYSFNITKADSLISDVFLVGTAVPNVPTIVAGQIVLLNNGCAPYGGTVTLSDLSTGSPVAIVTVNADQLYCDSFSIPVTFTTAGNHHVRVDFSGDSNVTGSSSSGYLNVSASTYSYVSLGSDVSSAVVGSPVTLSAQVSSDVRQYTATGSVTFLDGAASIGTAKLDATGTATLVVKTLVAGVHNISANYAGDAVLQPSTGGPITEMIADFTLQASPANITIPYGLNGTAIINVLPLGGSTQTVALSCGSLPADISCTFSPASVTLDGLNPGVIKVTVNTKLTVAKSVTPNRLLGAASTFAFAGLIFPFMRRKRLKTLLGILGIVLVTLGVVGCGSSSSNSNTTPTGTYVITVNASSGAGSAAKSIPLVVTISK